MFGTVQDITDRKRAEDKIREQEAELRQIVDFAPRLITVFGPRRERLYANRILLDYLGISLDEWRQKTDSSEFIHPDDRERVDAHSDLALSSGATYELEFRVRKSSGNYRWFLARFNPVRDDKGQIMRWYVTATDIEDRKRAEDALRRSEKELRQLIDVIPQQVFVFDSAWGPLFANQRELEYTGLTPQEAQSKDAIARIVHPEDLKKLEVLRRRALSDGSSFELEARIRGKDRQYRWFLIRDNPLRDEQGRVVRWYRRQRDAL